MQNIHIDHNETAFLQYAWIRDVWNCSFLMWNNHNQYSSTSPLISFHQLPCVYFPLASAHQKQPPSQSPLSCFVVKESSLLMFHDGKSSSDSDILSSFVCIICMNLQVDNYSFKIKLQRIKSPVGHLRGEKILTITIISTEITKILSLSWKSNRIW